MSVSYTLTGKSKEEANVGVVYEAVLTVSCTAAVLQTLKWQNLTVDGKEKPILDVQHGPNLHYHVKGEKIGIVVAK